MKTLTYPRIGEKAIWETLPNGLPVCVVPKPGYARKFAFFTTRYGGMDMRFRLDGQWLWFDATADRGMSPQFEFRHFAQEELDPRYSWDASQLDQLLAEEAP